jgi:hypothetical protein
MARRVRFKEEDVLRGRVPMTLELLAFMTVCWFVVVPCFITGLRLRRARFAESPAPAPARAGLRCEGRTRAARSVPSGSRRSVSLGE